MRTSFRTAPLWILALLAAPALWFGSGSPEVQLQARETTSVQAKGDPVDRAAAALYEGIRTETLPNGLRVYLKPIPTSPVVTTMVAYKVGSSDEDLEHTGLSHYLEHLMFKGTDKIKPGDIDRITQRNGGANNAYTTEDFTNFHFDFAADRWEVALQIEADRMRNLRIDARHEFQQEKGAVIEELERNEDTPWDLEGKAILPLLFGKTTPYGHPVIGEAQQVRDATAGVIQGYYNKWYHPNNAALVVCGGFDPDQALARIKELFGPIPAEPLPERKTAPAEVKRPGPVHKDMESKFEVPRLLLGFDTVRTGDPDYYALEVLQALLSEGKTSRLYKNLVEGAEIAGDVGASNSTGRYPGSFTIQVELLKGKSLPEAEKLVLEQLKQLREEPVRAAELKRVKRGLLAGAIFDRESVHNLADSIIRGVMTNDLEFLKTYLPRIAAVTAEDVQRAARKYLDPQQRVVIYSIPGGNTAANSSSGDKGGRNESPRKGARVNGEDKNSPTGNFSLHKARRVVLDNGLTLLLFENHRLPIVVAEAYVRDVRVLEPANQAGIATLMGRMLDEGTDKHAGPEIAEMIENVGGNLSLSGSGGSVQVLTPDRSLGLRLLFECLIHPTFPKAEFARERQRLLSEVDELEQQPDVKAQLVFKKVIYGSHPYGRPQAGTHQTVENLTPAQCRAFHERAFVPEDTVVAVVGDFDSQQVVAEVTKLTVDWKKTPAPQVKLPAIQKPEEFTQKILTMPDAAQLHFYLGELGIRRDNPDYYKLLVMDNVLGTGPGFTDRLSARLRDRQGLAYTVTANITSSANEQPGTFTCYIGTRPENFALVKKIFLEELNRIRDEPPTAQEVEDAKKYLLGSLPFQFTTTERIAAQLLYVERFHLGFDYPEDFRKAVAAVTPEDVQAVARKYLNPNRMVLVASGAIDQEGKPLHRAGPPSPATEGSGQ